jgi:CDP-diacylglycerol pyrophosphatase
MAVRALLAAFAAALLAAPATAGDPHPNALWDVVHGLCVRDARLTGRPTPCLGVDLRRGYAVVPDLRRRTQVLLVPTDRIAGIESPALLAPDAPNYWQAAWDARRYFENRAHRPVPRDLVGMAINSVASRSQDQLHIHIDCLRPEVRDILRARQDRIGFVWKPLGATLADRRWKVRSLRGEDLGDRDPFKLLARQNADARSHMDRQGLVVAGAVLADGSPGFYLLSTTDWAGFGESLLDHDCAALRDG